jgi:hypothetical protein
MIVTLTKVHLTHCSWLHLFTCCEGEDAWEGVRFASDVGILVDDGVACKLCERRQVPDRPRQVRAVQAINAAGR